MESFITNINLSDENLFQLGLLDKESQKFIEKLKKVNAILASKISLVSSSVSLFVDSNSEHLVMDEIKRKIPIVFSERKEEIQVYSSDIASIYIHG